MLRSSAVFWVVSFLGIGCARAQSAIATQLTLEGYNGGTEATGEYGNTLPLYATLTWAAPCPPLGQPEPQLAGTLTLTRDGVIVSQRTSFFHSLFRECANGVHTASQYLLDGEPEPGDYRYTVDYTGEPGMAASTSGVVHMQVRPVDEEVLVNGQGLIGLGTTKTPGNWSCAPATYGVPATVPPPPPGLRFPYGLVSYQMSCGFECDFLCPPGVPFGTHPEVHMLMDASSPLPPSAGIWAYTAGSDSGPPRWQRLSAEIYGNRSAFDVAGPSGTGSGSQIQGIAGIAVGDGPLDVQDMWWAGESENGWGLTISQNGEELFVEFFIYDDSGKPEWVVMPGGAWDGTHMSFSGQLYRPSGTWFGDYQASQFVAGNSVGTARLSFADDSDGALDLTLDGRTVHKIIARLRYAAPVQGLHAGLWWGGASENGWGLSISQQDQTLFTVWFTYDSQGKDVWYVMPGGTWTTDNVYMGTLYRTNASGWLVGYDSARFTATPVGTLTLTFSGLDKASIAYEVDGVAGSESLVRQPY